VDLKKTAQELLSVRVRLGALDETPESKQNLSILIKNTLKKTVKQDRNDPFALPGIPGGWNAVVESRAEVNHGVKEDVRMPALPEELAENDHLDEEMQFLDTLAHMLPTRQDRSENTSVRQQNNVHETLEEAVTTERFNQLPFEVQHEIILRLKDQSRQQSHQRLAKMIRSSRSVMDFSKQQIQNLMTRNYFTQKLHRLTGFGDFKSDSKLGRSKKVASDRRRRYVLLKDEQGGGWKFEAIGKKSNQGDEINPNKVSQVIADGVKSSFPLVGGDRVLYGDELFSDDDESVTSVTSQVADDEDDEGFSPVVVGMLPKDLQELMLLKPSTFDQTFAFGDDMIRSALGWSPTELKKALSECQCRIESVRGNLDDVKCLQDYESLIYWEDVLDKLLSRKEEAADSRIDANIYENEVFNVDNNYRLPWQAWEQVKKEIEVSTSCKVGHQSITAASQIALNQATSTMPPSMEIADDFPRSTKRKLFFEDDEMENELGPHEISAFHLVPLKIDEEVLNTPVAFGINAVAKNGRCQLHIESRFDDLI
jgi:hypothetical protein